MKKVLHGFIEALFDFADGDNRIKQTITGEGYRAKIMANNGTLRLIINKTQLEPDHEGEPVPSTEHEEVMARKVKQAQCAQIRNEFHRYISNLDKSLFAAVCRVFSPGDLARLNASVEGNDIDPNLMSEAIEIFKAATDKVIMNKVTRLKSQMTSFHPQ